MASNREVEKIVDEISEAAADGIRQCLTLAEDLQVRSPLFYSSFISRSTGRRRSTGVWRPVERRAISSCKTRERCLSHKIFSRTCEEYSGFVAEFTVV